MKKWLFPLLKKSERGVALIEFAIITPILIFLVLGIIEFGWMFNGWITITGAAREGARIASVYRVIEPDDYIIEAVKNHATPTFAEADIIVNPRQESVNPPGISASEFIVVEVEGTLDPIVGFFIRNRQTLYSEVTMRIE